MNAGPISLISLISDASRRFVIPVYQRPYSWDEEQCEQLWEDILTVGRYGDGTHFTGSVVWIQDGTMSAAGVTPLLLIDGQQRVTTLMLLLIALADYARRHGEKVDILRFSLEEIIDRGFLVSKYRKGDDHYRLTLSQGDRAVLKSIIDHLENPEVEIVDDSRRLRDNFEWFRTRLENIEDANIVWDGLQRLEVVSISLDQGKDNPQLIFESMNSTGKDLSTADLVRNYVLMGLPLDEQNALYENHWRKIEETLGADSYDDVFDGFLRDWLTVVNAPTPLVSRDVYRVFKRYVESNGYGMDGHIADLLKEIRRYAGYYARINSGQEKDSDLKRVLDRIHMLDMSVATPLLMALFDDYREGGEDAAFCHDDFVSMLRTLEAYIFRRMVCDLASNGLNRFFLSLVARLKELRDEGELNYREAFEAILLGESGTPRRMPDDEAFRTALSTRDCYAFRRAHYLLTTLENSHHSKDPIDFTHGVHTIEHIMPRNALAHESWRNMLGDDCEAVYERNVNRLGNLTLTAYNSELSDASFEEKKERVVGGYGNEYLSLSSELHDAAAWGEQQIEQRTQRLADEAVRVWPYPKLDEDTIAKYRPRRNVEASQPNKTVTFRVLCAAGFLNAGDALDSGASKYPAQAIVTDGYRIRLFNGEEFDSPSSAAIRAMQLVGSTSEKRNGWTFWNRDGMSLADIRSRYIASVGGVKAADRIAFRNMFWDGFFDYCANRNDFTSVFGDPSNRMDRSSYWVTFGVGRSGCHLGALLGMRDGYVAVEFYFRDTALYDELHAHRGQADSALAELQGDIRWDEEAPAGVKKSRHVVVSRSVDFDNEDWNDLYRWLADALLGMRTLEGFLG